jgi:MFS family permease
LGALIAGVANGAAYSLSPIYALGIGVEPQSVPLFTAAIVAGSALGVYPVGRVSDHMDRRLVIVVVMTLGVVAEATLAALRLAGWPLILMGFLVGLTTYTLYTLAASHANDRVKPHEMVAVSAGLLFIYCIGAIVAPPVASLLMRAYGPAALFVQAALVHLVIIAYALWRLIVEPEKAAPAAATP